MTTDTPKLCNPLQIVARQRAAQTTAKEPNMSTPAKSPRPRIFARLVRGRTYYLRDKLFTPEKEVEVSADERRHLEQHGVDYRFYPAREEGEEGETRALPKFEFRVE
jgi:hypothetical protein